MKYKIGKLIDRYLESTSFVEFLPDGGGFGKAKDIIKGETNDKVVVWFKRSKSSPLKQKVMMLIFQTKAYQNFELSDIVFSIDELDFAITISFETFLDEFVGLNQHKIMDIFQQVNGRNHGDIIL